VFDLSPEKIVVLGVIALVVLGPERLPRYARRAGQLMAQVRHASGSFQEEMRGALAEPRQALGDAAAEVGLTGLPRVPSVRRAVVDGIRGAIDTTSQPAAPIPSASARAAPYVDTPGIPPVPDDPSLN
jgi:sec-independent protein translocase protein TatB